VLVVGEGVHDGVEGPEEALHRLEAGQRVDSRARSRSGQVPEVVVGRGRTVDEG
jgi:hypothetical protein